MYVEKIMKIYLLVAKSMKKLSTKYIFNVIIYFWCC